MNQEWLEMASLRTRRLEAMTWITLRSSWVIERQGDSGASGFLEEFLGAGTVAIPVDRKPEALNLGWSDVGIGHHHRPYVEDSRYTPADTFVPRRGGFAGLHLVLEQASIVDEVNEWHVHPDLVLGLCLKREGDVWVCPAEGYIEVVRLRRRPDELSPCHIEIRAEHLKDFLCARGMGLCSTSYRSRRLIVTDAAPFTDIEGKPIAPDARDHWQVRTTKIHEGGMPFGGTRAAFHMYRTDVNPHEDVPEMGLPDDSNVEMQSWTAADTGKPLFSVHGELWRTEWLAPGEISPRVRSDEVTPRVFFITSAAGHQECSETLSDAGKWLWFKPDVIRALIERRGGGLQWYTGDTGGVWCSPGDVVHFGVNSLGLVNAYAKDVAMLAEWQQRVWAGFNLAPDGPVSRELSMAQVDAVPAVTRAPEAYLLPALTMLGQRLKERVGVDVLGKHADIPAIVSRCHRFRATDRAGLLALAKDLARVTADNLDTAALHRHLALAKGDRLGSLKSLERTVATTTSSENARAMLTALVGIYSLRLGDAHLPSNEIDEAFALVGVDATLPVVQQGFRLLEECVTALERIASTLKM